MFLAFSSPRSLPPTNRAAGLFPFRCSPSLSRCCRAAASRRPAAAGSTTGSGSPGATPPFLALPLPFERRLNVWHCRWGAEEVGLIGSRWEEKHLSSTFAAFCLCVCALPFRTASTPRAVLNRHYVRDLVENDPAEFDRIAC